MKLESTVRQGLANLLNDVDTNVVIDEVDQMGGPDGEEALAVSFHLEGAWGGPAVYCFPFAQSIPVENSFADLRDLLSRSWTRSHLPPPIDSVQVAGA